MQSWRFWLGCFALCLDSVIERLASLKALGARIAKASTLILALGLGGCATTQPAVTNTTGAVETLMKDPAYAVAAVKELHAQVLRAHGGSPGIRDENLLESAVAAPQATMMGQPMIEDPVEMAASYLFIVTGKQIGRAHV